MRPYPRTVAVTVHVASRRSSFGRVLLLRTPDSPGLHMNSPGLLLKRVQNCFSKFVFWCLICRQFGIQSRTVRRSSFCPGQNYFSSFNFQELNAGQCGPQPRTVRDLTRGQSGLPTADSPGFCRLCCFLSFSRALVSVCSRLIRCTSWSSPKVSSHPLACDQTIL